MNSTIARLVVKRLGSGALTLLIVSLVIFTITALLPGDAAQALLGQEATPETVAALRAQFGLDQPAHLRYLNPMPLNTEQVVKAYDRVLIPEVNLGQLSFLIRARFLVDAEGLNKVRGKPFRIAEIVEKAEQMLQEKS